MRRAPCPALVARRRLSTRLRATVGGGAARGGAKKGGKEFREDAGMSELHFGGTLLFGVLVWLVSGEAQLGRPFLAESPFDSPAMHAQPRPLFSDATFMPNQRPRVPPLPLRITHAPPTSP